MSDHCGAWPVLKAETFKGYVDYFNSMEDENVVNLVPNAQSWEWMSGNIPLFECPDKAFERIYYYRWWAFRKHIKQTPDGRVVTEFLTPVKHAGAHNTVSCAAGFHICEGRWLHGKDFLDEYILFWLRGNGGKPQPHLHKYSSWLHDALWEKYMVDGDKAFIIDLLPDLIADYRAWEAERMLPDGLFWQYDVWDAMEESISGSRKDKNARPTISSYMYANARAMANIARLAGRNDTATEFDNKAESIKAAALSRLWDAEAEFFKVRLEATGRLSDAREAIGFIPWMFNLPDKSRGCEKAWLQAVDPNGFSAPCGLTTAERRHPRFRSHGVGRCEWDGAVWPFATSQTLLGMANALNNYEQEYITKKDYFDALMTYGRSHLKNGKPFIGEYHDEVTGYWLKGENERQRYYNHSLFADLVVTGLAGLRPQPDEVIHVNPLVPDDGWDWFCLDRVPYHGRNLAVVWDKTGQRYGKGRGLSVWLDGNEIAREPRLGRVKGRQG
ncbi:MAG TPA: glycosyl hydrolase family 65 protein [Sedimentisphaerales bacterium]|nr:glycosyl hydrolase family 65 protein [Sedimentisphaerales bacterium]